MYSLRFKKENEESIFADQSLVDFAVVKKIVNSRGRDYLNDAQLLSLFNQYDGGRLQILLSDNDIHNLAVCDLSLGYSLLLYIDSSEPAGTRKKLDEFLQGHGLFFGQEISAWKRVYCKGNKQEVIRVAEKVLSVVPVNVICKISTEYIEDNIVKVYTNSVTPNRVSFESPKVSKRDVRFLKNGVFNCGVIFYQEHIKCPDNIEDILKDLGAKNIALFFDDGKCKKYTFDKEELEEQFKENFYKAIGYIADKPIWVPLFVDRGDKSFIDKPKYVNVAIRKLPKTFFDFSGDDLSTDPRLW